MNLIRTTAVFVVAVALAVLPLAFDHQVDLYVYSPAKAGLLAALGTLLLILATAERVLARRRITPGDAPEAVAFFALAWLGLACLFAVNRHTAWVHWLQWAAAVLAFWFVRRAPEEERRFVAAAGIIGAVLTAAVGYAQLRGWGPPRAADQYGEVLLTSTFGHANYAAQVVVGVAVALLAAAQVASRSGFILTSVLVTTILFPYLFLSQSRGAWFATATTIFVSAVLLAMRDAWGYRRRALVTIVLVGLFGLGSVVASSRVRERLTDAMDARSPSTAIRLAIWNDTLAMVLASPILGYGPGQFVFSFPRHWSEHTQKRVFAGGPHLVENPHQDWLGFMVAAGLPFAFAVGLLLALGLRRVWRGLRPTPLTWGATGATLSWAIYGFVDYPLHNPVPLLGFFTSLGLMSPLHPADDAVAHRRWPAWSAFGFSLLALAPEIPAQMKAIRSQTLAIRAMQYLAVQPETALRIATQAADLDSFNAAAFSVMGQAKLARKDRGLDTYYDAETYLRRALELYPTDFISHFNLGLALYQRAQDRNQPFDDARAAFNAALRINPYYGRPYFMLATLNAVEGEPWLQVRRNLDRAIKLDPQLFIAAGQAPEFAPYRDQPGWNPWYEGLRQRLNIHIGR